MEITTGTEQGEGGEGTGGPDVASLIGGFGTKLDEFSQSIGQRLDALERPAAVEEEPEEGAGEAGEEEGFVPQFAVEDFGENGELTVEAQTRAIAEIAQRQVQQALAPIQEQRTDERRTAYADALEERYPDLADEDKQDQYLDLAAAEASRLAQITGRPELAQLAAEPEFLEVVYLMEQSRRRAGDEIPAGSQREVTLEPGGGAGPASAAGESDDGDRIVSLANKSKFRLGA